MINAIVRFSRKPFVAEKQFSAQGQLLAKFSVKNFEEYESAMQQIREDNFQEFNFPYIYAVAINV